MPKGHVPYRGDGDLRIKKPRRKFINVIKDRREFRILLIIVAVFLGFLVYTFTKNPRGKYIDGDAIFGFTLVTAIVVMILSAIYSFTKFRKGYDIDISDGEDKENDEDKISE